MKAFIIIILFIPLLVQGEEKVDWPFDQARNVAAVTTETVINSTSPVLSVIHYSEDDSWAFLSGTSDDFVLVTMEQVVSTDPSLKDISDLPPGWSANRESIHHDWLRTKGE